MTHSNDRNYSQARLVRVDKNDPKAVARARQQIKLMYDAQARAYKLSPEKLRKTIRIRDIERVLVFNYRGGPLTDDSAGREDLVIMIHHLIKTGSNRHGIHRWAQRLAPWASTEVLDDMIVEAETWPRIWNADELAAELGLTFATRTALGVTTIGSVDLDKAARESRQAELSRLRKEAARRTKGAKPRAEYEAKSANRNKPWVSEGKSRATYYRELKARRELETTAAGALEGRILVQPHLSHCAETARRDSEAISHADSLRHRADHHLSFACRLITGRASRLAYDHQDPCAITPAARSWEGRRNARSLSPSFCISSPHANASAPSENGGEERIRAGAGPCLGVGTKGSRASSGPR
jgi:hypothetical protein